MTWREIRNYVKYENRDAEYREVGSYESLPFTVFAGHDDNGNQKTKETTTPITVHILGDAAHGYILVTEDEADGPDNDLGDDVYPTLLAALDMLDARVDWLPEGDRLRREVAS